MVLRSAEECRRVWSGAGKGWGAFKLLYYHCNTTKIDRVEQPRMVCGAEECRGVPRSAEEWRGVLSGAGKGWGRHWGAFELLYYHCNTTKIDRVEQPRMVCGAEECRRVPSTAEEYHCNTTKIDRVEQPRTVCGAEECRAVPKSVEWCWQGVGQTLGSLQITLLPLQYH